METGKSANSGAEADEKGNSKRNIILLSVCLTLGVVTVVFAFAWFIVRPWCGDELGSVSDDYSRAAYQDMMRSSSTLDEDVERDTAQDRS